MIHLIIIMRDALYLPVKVVLMVIDLIIITNVLNVLIIVKLVVNTDVLHVKVVIT